MRADRRDTLIRYLVMYLEAFDIIAFHNNLVYSS